MQTLMRPRLMSARRGNTRPRDMSVGRIRSGSVSDAAISMSSVTCCVSPSHAPNARPARAGGMCMQAIWATQCILYPEATAPSIREAEQQATVRGWPRTWEDVPEGQNQQMSARVCSHAQACVWHTNERAAQCRGWQCAHVVCLGAGTRDTLMHHILLRAAAGKDGAAACGPNTDTRLLYLASLSLYESTQHRNCTERGTLHVA